MGYYLDEATLSDHLIAFLFSCRSHSMRKAILWDRVSKRRNISKEVYRQNLYRLKKKGFVEYKDNFYYLSEKGKKYYINPYKRIKSKYIKKKKIIIIFDIPEKHKRAREWIREQIRFWKFEMIQKSVWVGYGPLPEEFKKRLKILNIEKGIKIFNVQVK